ncbi:MAG: UxaA family hydrolase [Chloroflexi bacterium]|nr:UxaA family hydrolase [Chloroflexota bacterium]
MTTTYQFKEIGRLPLPGDNVAIATRRLKVGTEIIYNDQYFTLDRTVMEGHRFAIQPIAPGEELLSWELPFGVALKQINPGDYVCNAAMLDALSVRSLDFTLPTEPNFADRIQSYTIDKEHFQPAPPVPVYAKPRTFMGYRRAGSRGVGTRNIIVLLGVTSRTSSYVRQLEARLKATVKAYPNIDDLVAAAHTEGDFVNPNNQEILLRTLAGFMVNSNVGAVLAVDYGIEPVTNAMLRAYMEEHHYPLADVPHEFISLTGGFQENLARGEAIVRGWLDQVNRTARTEESVAHLKIALQCGGSDAFSGISGNPLLGWVAHEVVRNGGATVLAETDELIGAESYVLQKVANLEIAQTFLNMIERFKEYASWHGASAEGNPSGGNKYRGLYNITLKSIGAGMKKDPRTRIDHAIDYAMPIEQPGYYFMDSPGNDLEGIAGQVAAGCNMIWFVTGNGSITNFPYVPTMKIVTTTKRFELLHTEMDVNAGAYLDGTPMDELGQQTFEYVLKVASGQLSVGEKAGHAQVQVWRNWMQTDTSNVERLLHLPKPNGASLPIKSDVTVPNVPIKLTRSNGRRASDQIGLILPTSLCSSQVATMLARRLNQKKIGQGPQLSRYVALGHTEGCGSNSGPSEDLYIRTMLGYIAHPLVKHCMLIEHGCEKTHNDYMRHAVQDMGLDDKKLGWASIQLDGGIENVQHKLEEWFSREVARDSTPATEIVGLEGLRLGLLSDGPVPAAVAHQLAQITKMVVKAGGSVVVPENTGLLSSTDYRSNVLQQPTVLPSLAYGEHMATNGFHIMETPTEHWVETLTGLAATGVELILAYVGEQPMQSHPLVPVVQITANAAMPQQYSADLDLILTNDLGSWQNEIFQLITRVLEHDYAPKLTQQGNVDFQLTRGLLGVTL